MVYSWEDTLGASELLEKANWMGQRGVCSQNEPEQHRKFGDISGGEFGASVIEILRGQGDPI